MDTSKAIAAYVARCSGAASNAYASAPEDTRARVVKAVEAAVATKVKKLERIGLAGSINWSSEPAIGPADVGFPAIHRVVAPLAAAAPRTAKVSSSNVGVGKSAGMGTGTVATGSAAVSGTWQPPAPPAAGSSSSSSSSGKRAQAAAAPGQVRHSVPSSSSAYLSGVAATKGGQHGPVPPPPPQPQAYSSHTPYSSSSSSGAAAAGAGRDLAWLPQGLWAPSPPPPPPPARAMGFYGAAPVATASGMSAAGAGYVHPSPPPQPMPAPGFFGGHAQYASYAAAAAAGSDSTSKTGKKLSSKERKAAEKEASAKRARVAPGLGQGYLSLAAGAPIDLGTSSDGDSSTSASDTGRGRGSGRRWLLHGHKDARGRAKSAATAEAAAMRARRLERFASSDQPDPATPHATSASLGGRGLGHGKGQGQGQGQGLLLSRATSVEAAAGLTRTAGTGAGAGAGAGYGYDDDDVLASSMRVVGTSTALERRYLRLTGPPDPAVVRPPRVLRQALALARSKWSQAMEGEVRDGEHAPVSAAGGEGMGHAYKRLCEQLKCVRQDLAVQARRGLLAVRAYETHARAALVVGDFSEFNQCQTQLGAIGAGGAGASTAAAAAAGSGAGGVGGGLMELAHADAYERGEVTSSGSDGDDGDCSGDGDEEHSSDEGEPVSAKKDSKKSAKKKASATLSRGHRSRRRRRLDANAAEFLCYRLAYSTVTGDRAGILSVLRQTPPRALRHPAVRFTLAVGAALSRGDYCAFFDLYERGLAALPLLPPAPLSSVVLSSSATNFDPFAPRPIPTYNRQPFLLHCFTSRLLSHVRDSALRALMSAARPAPLPAAAVAALLRFAAPGAVTRADAALLGRATCSAGAQDGSKKGVKGGAGKKIVTTKAAISAAVSSTAKVSAAAVAATASAPGALATTLVYTGHWWGASPGAAAGTRGAEWPPTAANSGNGAGGRPSHVSLPHHKEQRGQRRGQWRGILDGLRCAPRPWSPPPAPLPARALPASDAQAAAAVATVVEFVLLRGGTLTPESGSWPPADWGALSSRAIAFVTAGEAGQLHTPDPADEPGAEDAVKRAMEMGITHAHFGLLDG